MSILNLFWALYLFFQKIILDTIRLVQSVYLFLKIPQFNTQNLLKRLLLKSNFTRLSNTNFFNLLNFSKHPQLTITYPPSASTFLPASFLIQKTFLTPLFSKGARKSFSGTQTACFSVLLNIFTSFFKAITLFSKPILRYN